MREVDLATVGTFVGDFWTRSGNPALSHLEGLAAPGALYLGSPPEMPSLDDHFFSAQVVACEASAGGQHNTTLPLRKAGLNVVGIGAMGVNGSRSFDTQGRFLLEVMEQHGIPPFIQEVQDLSTGTTFKLGTPGQKERPGLVYFPQANLATDLNFVMDQIRATHPKIVHWMYMGLMGDADRSLGRFFRECRCQTSCIVSADAHTIQQDAKVLQQALPELDIFFCSADDAKLIATALQLNLDDSHPQFVSNFLTRLYDQYAGCGSRRPLFGVTMKNGAYFKVDEENPQAVTSNYTVENEDLNLVGAGDAFRAGVLGYVSQHVQEFRGGKMNYRDAVQLGNLMAVLCITAPVKERLSQIAPFKNLERIAATDVKFGSVTALTDALKA